MNSANCSPYHRYPDMEAGFRSYRDNGEDDEEIASVPLLKRWRKACHVLNASHRFHYTLHLKTQQEKEERRRKIIVHVQVIQAALLFKAVKEQDTGSPHAPTSNGDYGIGPEEHVSVTRGHNLPDLERLQMVHMQHQMQYSHPSPHQQFQNSQVRSGYVQHYNGPNPFTQGMSPLSLTVGPADSSVDASRTLLNSPMESGHSPEGANALFLNNVVALSTCLVTIGTAGSFSFFQLNDSKGRGDASLNHILKAINVLLCASSLIAYVVALIFSLTRNFPGKILMLKIVLGSALVSFVLGYILVAVFNFRK